MSNAEKFIIHAERILTPTFEPPVRGLDMKGSKNTLIKISLLKMVKSKTYVHIKVLI